MATLRCPRCGLDYEPITPGDHNGIHASSRFTPALDPNEFRSGGETHRVHPGSVVHRLDCPGCMEMMERGTPYTATPMSETYWAS